MKRLLFTLICLTSLAGAQSTRDTAWLQDLDTLATQLPKLHPNLFYYSPRAVFDREVTALRNEIPSLPESDIMIRMAAIVALAHDGHTALMLTQRPTAFRMLPLSFQWFEDGLFVTGASEAYARARGAKVLRMGDRSADEAYEAVKRIISYEADGWAREISPAYLANADALRALGVAPASDSVRLELQDREGAFALDVASARGPLGSTILPKPDEASGHMPLYQQNRNQNYWFAYLDSSRTLYFAYNACQEMPNLPFARFNDQFWAVFDAHPVDLVVADLRNNNGGSSGLIAPFLQSALAREARLSGVRMALITGRGTFSSGLMNAIDLHNGPVVSYGEATGANASHYGQVGFLTLIQSALSVRYSTRYFSYPTLPPGPLLPDVAVPIYSSDYFARHDPFLAAVMAGAAPGVQVESGPVVNAATFRAPVAPGSIASFFGGWGDLAAEGVEVSVNDTPARVFAVARGQINFRIPPETRPGTATVRATRGGVTIEVGTVRVTGSAPGLFAAIVRGRAIEIYGTGQGDGNDPRVYVGSSRAEVTFSGAHPDFPGLWQINAIAPESIAGGETPVFVTTGGAASNAAVVQIQN